MNDAIPQRHELENRFPQILCWLVIAVGIVLRLVMFSQDRSLIIDEANIARNLFERGYIRLLSPLAYEQYAPPLFLWIEKFITSVFGFGTKALKLFPMFCGIAMLFVFYDILKRIVSKNIIWIPLAFLAFSPYFVEFSATVKQYISDSFVILILIWLALKVNLSSTSRLRFCLLWILTGSISIAFAMPSVFALAAISFYYSWDSIRERNWKNIILLLFIAIAWLSVFSVYYLFILKPQIESSYLQNYHAQHFLHLLPANYKEWKHNYKLIREIFYNSTGHTFVNFLFTIICVVTAFISLFKKRKDLLILILTPILLTMLAAALHQYSLIMRVSLFLLPLFLLIFSAGLDTFWNMKPKAIKYVVIIAALINITIFNNFNILIKKFGFHEIKEGMNYLLHKKIQGDHIYIHDSSKPTYIYYTTIDPQREQYATLLGANLMNWDSDYTHVTKGLTDTVYFLYSGGFPDVEKVKRTRQIEQNMKQVDYFEKDVCFVYGYAPKN